MRSSTFKLNAALTPRLSLYAGQTIESSLSRSNPIKSPPPSPTSQAIVQSKLVAALGLKLPIVEPGKYTTRRARGSPVSGSNSGPVKSPWTGRTRRLGKLLGQLAGPTARAVRARCRPADKHAATEAARARAASSGRCRCPARSARNPRRWRLPFRPRASRGSPFLSASDNTRRARKSRRRGRIRPHRRNTCRRFPFAAASILE